MTEHLILKGKSLRRAMECKNSDRISGREILPLITFETVWVTPEMAHKMLEKNIHNRTVSNMKVNSYAKMIEAGEWKLNPHGIVLDSAGNILTGQKRLEAITKCGKEAPMIICRGVPAETSRVIDRGSPQSARDLAERELSIAGKKQEKITGAHATIARAMCAIEGNLKPSTDDIANMIQVAIEPLNDAVKQTGRVKKTKPRCMIIAAAIQALLTDAQLSRVYARLELLDEKLQMICVPPPVECWGKVASFKMALDHARDIVLDAVS